MNIIGLFLAVFGSLFTALKTPRQRVIGFIAYLLSNVAWIIYSLSVGEHVLLVQCLAFSATSILGLVNNLRSPK